jgi:hypothetical protein
VVELALGPVVEEVVGAVAPLDLREKRTEVEGLREKVERRGVHPNFVALRQDARRLPRVATDATQDLRGVLHETTGVRSETIVRRRETSLRRILRWFRRIVVRTICVPRDPRFHRSFVKNDRTESESSRVVVEIHARASHSHDRDA